MFDRRAFLRAAALAGGAAVLAACGGNAAAPSTAPTAAPAAAPTNAPAAEAATAVPAPTSAPAAVQPSGGTVTIEWFNRYTTPTTQQILPLMIGEFEKQNPNIKVNYQNPGNGDGYVEALLSRIAGGNPPDVATLYEPPVEFAARGSLFELDEYMKSATNATADAFFPNVLKSCQWQNKTYGLPSSAGAAAIYINSAKFKEKNITFARDSFPKTWDDLKILSKEFVSTKDGVVTSGGFVPFVGNSWMYPAWSAMNGGTIFDSASSSYKIDSDQNIQWIESWVNWLNEQYGGDLEKLNTAGNWAGTYPDTAFNLGKVAMAGEGSWSTTDADIPFAFDVAKLPYGPGGSKSLTAFYPNWWVIPKGTKQPEAAFKLLEFIATSGWETWYKFIMDTPSWKKFPPDVLTTKLVDAVGLDKAKNYNSFFADYLNDAVEMWTSPIETFAQDTFGTAVTEALSKKKSPKQALADAQKLCQDKLKATLKA
jgi:ABC-type glycerol-3-phosphate transport system substrate-binding protein